MGFRPWQKMLVFWAVFMLMYGVYRFLPVFPLSLICAINESNYQHYKAGFFAWIIASLIEYVVMRRRLVGREQFAYSRLAAATFLPWFIFVVWYTVPALYGRWSQVAFEILYANIVTLIVGLFVAVFEQAFAQACLTRGLKAVIVILALLALLEYQIFTVRLPWADVFVEPNWR